MPDCTFFELHVHDSFDFAPTTAVGADALAAMGLTDGSDRADGSDDASAESEAASDSESDPDSNSDGVGRVLLTAVALAVVSTVVAVAVARLLSDDAPADLADLDEHEPGTAPGDDSPPRPP